MCKMRKFAFWQNRNDVITYILVTLAPYTDFEIQIKVLLHVFKSLSHLAPPYLTELLQPYNPARALTSTNQLL